MVLLPGLQHLTVNSGSGSGDHIARTTPAISADAAPSGYVFSEWTGETSSIADVHLPSTSIKMPFHDVEITASYEPLYMLTVNSGSGEGSYPAGAVVAVAADPTPSGHVFDRWVGDTAGITDVDAESTTLTMPAGNVEITATY